MARVTATATTGAQPVPALRVRSRSPSFWRAGRLWSRDPVEVLLDSLSPEQQIAIRDEPMLIVEDIEL